MIFLKTLCVRRPASVNVIIAALVATASIGASTATQAAETLGFVLTRWHVANWETPGAKTECPDGYVAGGLEQWRAEYKTPEERDAHLKRFGNRTVRGANGENSFWSPHATQDPIPFREVQSKIAHGLNLDGTEDGRETEKTCAHQKFTSPDGELGIDNQLYRLVGCSATYRIGGWLDNFENVIDRVKRLNRYLLEITDVDDRTNDDSVGVAVYNGIDELLLDANGKPVPWTTQRVDTRTPYWQRTRGKIVGGVLTTEPVFLRLPMEQTGLGPEERQVKHMRLRLTLTPNGAKGLLAGYVDTEFFWRNYAKLAARVPSVNTLNGPSSYNALMRLADGDKNANGQCTSISAAYDVVWTPAIVVHPEASPTAQRSGPAATTQGQR